MKIDNGKLKSLKKNVLFGFLIICLLVFCFSGCDDKTTNGDDDTGNLQLIWQGVRSTAPENPQPGYVYYNTESGKTLVYDGSEWKEITISVLAGSSDIEANITNGVLYINGDAIGYVGGSSEQESIQALIDAAIAGKKLNADGETWDISVSGIDLSDTGFMQVLNRLAYGITDDKLFNLDLSGCKGTILNNNTSTIIYAKERVKSITLPSSIKIISEYTFSPVFLSGPKLWFPDYVYSNLETINGPGVTFIGSNAFAYCRKLKNVNFPEVEIIDWCAFERCNSLIDVSLPKARNLGGAIFRYCENLKSVYMPESTNFDMQLFMACNSLTRVTLGTITQENFNEFYGLVGLREAYFAPGGGAGTYTTNNPGEDAVWVKQ